MTTQPEALRLADQLGARYSGFPSCDEAAAELRRLSALVAACEPYLKDGETPAERIERERGDTEAVCRLYAKEREKNQELLEALKKAADHAYWPDIEKQIRAAIAKAEGQA